MNTPTPLTIFETSNDLDFYCDINDALGETICSVYEHPKSDIRAAEIVRAVNYHDRLVDMVEQLRADLKAARSALYIVGRLQEAQINSKSIQYSEQLLTEIKESK